VIDDPVLVNDWHPVASVRQLAVHPVQGTRVLGEDLVVWRQGEQIFVWRDLCVHRGTRLSLGTIVDGCLSCPYHGWRYDASGRCAHMPAAPHQAPSAKAAVKTYLSAVAYGLVWACLGEPRTGPPPFPEWDDADLGKAVCGPYAHLRANGPRLIENFLDAAHFPFVHAGILGDPAHAEIGDYATHVTDDGIESDAVRVYQPDPYGGSAGEVAYTYHAYRPLTAHFTKRMPLGIFALLLTVTPHDALDSSAWFLVASSAVLDDAALAADYCPRIARIFEQDRPIVESQRPEALPMDLQAELHLRSDRMAIAYRKWLSELGVRLGVA
jgi:phenylpropionate dioxygenase-like ring-hydroxylating dioxygenase large terminal subunit